MAVPPVLTAQPIGLPKGREGGARRSFGNHIGSHVLHVVDAVESSSPGAAFAGDIVRSPSPGKRNIIRPEKTNGVIRRSPSLDVRDPSAQITGISRHNSSLADFVVPSPTANSCAASPSGALPGAASRRRRSPSPDDRVGPSSPASSSTALASPAPPQRDLGQHSRARSPLETSKSAMSLGSNVSTSTTNIRVGRVAGGRSGGSGASVPEADTDLAQAAQISAFEDHIEHLGG